MKFLFLDEFKYKMSASEKVYGLTGIVIDAQYYLSFKKSFYSLLSKLGWDEKFELKGRSMFSISGDKSIPIKDRIDFMRNIVDISKSGTGKSAKIHVFASIKVYDDSCSEYECYKNNLNEIIQKIPKPENKKKSLIGIFYDENSCINPVIFHQDVEGMLSKRGLNIFESPISIKSSLNYPGIMFADYVSYFFQNFLQLSEFRGNNQKRILELLEKYKKGIITKKEKDDLDIHVKNYQKEETSKELIIALKKIIFC